MSYGALCIALTFLVAAFGNLVQASLTVFGILGGPVLGVFLLGMLTRRANEKGTVVGLLVSIAVSAWIGFGASAYGQKPVGLPVTTDGCAAVNASSAPIGELGGPPLLKLATSPDFDSLFFLNTTVKEEILEDSDGIFYVYKLSYMWIAPIGFAISFIVGYTASLISDLIIGKPEDVPDELLSPFRRCCSQPEEGKKEKKEKKQIPIVMLEKSQTIKEATPTILRIERL